MNAGSVRLPCDEGVIRSRAADAPGTPGTGPWVLAATILGSSLAFIDGTVVNVALPAVQADLRATAAGVQWVVAGYALTLAALILVGGALGDRYGRRRVYLAGVALFALASIWCGLAPDIGQLIVARAVQGVGGALLVPGSLAIIGASFAGAARGRAIGTWSGFTAITTALGPVLGGWLVEHASWRAVFFLTLPLAAVTLAITCWKVPETRDDTATGRLDWTGAALATLGLGALVYGLIDAGARGFGRPAVIGALAVGVVALAAFLAVEARAGNPMLPLGLLRSRTFDGANLLTLLLYAALGGSLYFLPFNLIQVQGYSATAAGAANLPFVALLSGLSRWSGGLAGRYGARLPLTIGPVIAGAGFGLLALPGIGGSYWTTFFPPIVVLGLGLAIAVAPLTTTVLDAVEERHVGVASGINNAVARAAGLLAVAILSIVVANAFDGALAGRLDALPLSPAARAQIEAQRDRLAGATIPPEVTGDAHAAAKRAIDEAFVAAFRLAMLIGAGLALASALSAALLIVEEVPDARRPERSAGPTDYPLPARAAKGARR